MRLLLHPFIPWAAAERQILAVAVLGLVLALPWPSPRSHWGWHQSGARAVQRCQQLIAMPLLHVMACFFLVVVSEPPRMTLPTSLFKQYYSGLGWLTGGGIINSRSRASSGKCDYLLQWSLAHDLLLSFFLVKTAGQHYYTISMK